ncbi:MAG: DUF488 domain-containing protein [Prevotellaceae bacterium]|jgi:uncharacterized protein (DUF488 family)|nr:DUF488 domain-containing protein [Prevotellaceae bacterium]
MFYRRKIILALLEASGGALSAISFQKLLFLLTRRQEVKAFDFVPYRYGCFSFQANQDIVTLKNRGYLHIAADDNSIHLAKNECYAAQLSLFDRQHIAEVAAQFGDFSQTDLVKYTYLHFPYYATKSTIAKKILTPDEFKKVQQQIRTYPEPALFTIGYEGISLETYVNKLILHDVKTLCDVRKNAFSQKYGFSKSQLKMACEGVAIKYVHVPSLGITSDKRQHLQSQGDYDALFDDYKKTVLAQNAHDVKYLFDLLTQENRIALTCFEANVNQCHRKHLAETISQLPDFKCSLKHI